MALTHFNLLPTSFFLIANMKFLEVPSLATIMLSAYLPFPKSIILDQLLVSLQLA